MTIAVVGAGITGLAVAAALTRAGVQCHVFEQATRLHSLGAGIQISPNGARVLLDLGLGPALKAIAVRPAELQVRTWSTDQIAVRTLLGDECLSTYGAPYLCMRRADLHRSLFELLPIGMVHIGCRCTALVERDEEVLLQFADGSSITADLVIGADGIHSAVRRAYIDDDPRFSGHSLYRGVTLIEDVPELAGSPAVAIWMGPHQHCVCYPVGSGTQVSFAASAPAPVGPESWSEPGKLSELLAAYQGWNPTVLQVFTKATGLTKWALHDRHPLSKWSTRRLVLAGDAAHPMLPFGAQGASLGLEDAIVLAGLLSQCREQPGAALQRYEEIRMPRVERVRRFILANERDHHLIDTHAQRRRDEELNRQWVIQERAWLFGYDARATVESLAGAGKNDL